MMDETRLHKRLLRFAVGLALVLGMAFLLGSGMTPPGELGEVIRHSHDFRINATALFYSELENMQEMEREVVDVQADARNAKP